MVQNIPEFSVSEISFALKRAIEDGFSQVRVRGELSKVKIHSSGHLYSDLKDDQSLINLVCWRAQVAKLKIKPEEGLEVICTGRLTTYPARSNYQLQVEHMEIAGQGALLKMLEERKRKLEAEGLFAQAHKKPLPFLPDHIAIITSPTGAVIQDMIHRLQDRCPRPVMLFPVRVQGEGAAEEIIAALKSIRILSQLKKIPRPDVIVIARGGGSIEDLMAFNDENLVRLIAEFEIPIVSAVGHETDTTLIDFAADMRAPTPTAAAEFIVPERQALLLHLQDLQIRMTQSLWKDFQNTQRHLQLIASKLERPEKLWQMKSQRLDHASDLLVKGLQRLALKKEHDLGKVIPRLRPPVSVVQSLRQKLEWVTQKKELRFKSYTEKQENRLENLAMSLELLSFKNTLKRGYAVIRACDLDGQKSILASQQEAKTHKKLDIEWFDGQIEVEQGTIKT
jgi:exodeoxyribonuclease VII large subunit